MTLDELLALLPDNDTGEIDAVDLRTIVTELYREAQTQLTSYAFKWTDDQSPPTGRITMDQPWAIFATKILVNETSDDGTALTFALLDNSAAARVWLSTADGSKLEANITGPSNDLTDYREVPIAVSSVIGPSPNNGEFVTVTVVTVLGTGPVSG